MKAEYVPAMHGMHSSGSVSAATDEYLPRSQSPQAADPVAAEYVPGSQGRHESSEVALVAPEALPSLHTWHVVELLAPKTLEYVPGVQGLHVSFEIAPVCRENVPRSQSVQKEAPPVEYLPPTHRVHVSGELAPLTDENLAAGQGAHELFVVAIEAENVPASQRVHDEVPYEPRGQSSVLHAGSSSNSTTAARIWRGIWASSVLA